MDLIKYDMTDIWASAGDVVAPDSTKINQGWGVEVVPRQWWNWFENRQDNNLAYMLQKGFPEWDATTEYIINKSYVQRSGIVYKATATSTNSDPVALTSWVKAFPESSAYLEVIRPLAVVNNGMAYIDGSGVAQNAPTTSYGRSILNVADALAARTLSGSQAAHANLTGLSSVSGDANNLPYFTGGGAMGVTVLTGFARTLLDDANAAAMRATLVLGDVATLNIGTTAGTVAAGDDARIVNALQKANNLSELTNVVAARSNLGLTSTAITPITTSTTDNTAGRVLKVADFGLGTQGVRIGSADALSNTGTGVYTLGTPFTGGPIASQPCTIIHTAYDNERTQIAIIEGISNPRIFYRKYSAGVWASWVETYHTGNTQSIVDQVTAGIQPQLDAKVGKAGGTGNAMTGPLFVPGIEVGASGTAYMDFHVASAADYDARISAFSGTSVTGAARLGYEASGGHYFTGTINGTCTVAQTLTGNIPISQVTSLQATLDAKMPLAGAGSPIFNSLKVQTTGVVMNVQGMGIVWNEAGNGSASFINNQGGGSGGFVFRNVNASNTVETGRVTFGGGGNITCAGSVTVGSGLFNQDGNINGTVWGGWLSNWMATNLVYKGTLRQDSVNQLNVGELGSVAFCYTNPGVTPGGQVGGGNMLYGFAAGQGGVNPPGTWRCHGDVSPGGRTLFMRIA